VNNVDQRMSIGLDSMGCILVF